MSLLYTIKDIRTNIRFETLKLKHGEADALSNLMNAQQNNPKKNYPFTSIPNDPLWDKL